ncbi:hypothetical protein LJU02_04080 [Corynebacterium pseudotuberculosis]|uniref:Uncharacterized protein n=2 Tax=Corynebacterium pseudotuberculosis TaxID=1719 RepID=D9Q9Q3_CORP2|nr:hypothetical protein [Corynebacterium pseudotuberculosis]AER68860.1 Hypothetical protein Cp106_0781 [Corynebacterium pseudotuberculosis 1/06-A]ADK28591.1 hypothetical protein CPFRC_04005 [Corynebacterium pseudotuberculosis FRC41]ADL10279.1 hypothetical protein CPC231_04005 [Corynebacterium pseudotuberculosis C231]ADL20687.1 hypothetical protein CP1002_09130 [Corynebacterium pseudotuberculosis 1002]ADO26071.1 hypothetical protein CPI19_07515 [Corynebacterium pseudotuberculosis I19]
MSRRAAVIGSLLVGVIALSGCARFEPKADPILDQNKVIVIAVDPGSWEQVVLGEAYSQALQHAGREAVIRVSATTSQTDPLRLISQGEADLYISCTGKILTLANPHRARELSDDYAKNKAASTTDQWRESVYSEMMASLGNNVNATDPSNTIGCENETPELPQNLVPVYREPVFTRDNRNILNLVSGSLSTKKLQKLVEEAEQGMSASAPVEKFLKDSKL